MTKITKITLNGQNQFNFGAECSEADVHGRLGSLPLELGQLISITIPAPAGLPHQVEP